MAKRDDAEAKLMAAREHARERAPDWVNHGIQLPRDTVALFKVAGAHYGPGGVRAVATAAINLFLGLPESVRTDLVLWVKWASERGLDEITPEHAAEVYAASMIKHRAHAEGAPRQDMLSTAFFVERILMPDYFLDQLVEAPPPDAPREAPEAPGSPPPKSPGESTPAPPGPAGSAGAGGSLRSSA